MASVVRNIVILLFISLSAVHADERSDYNAIHKAFASNSPNTQELVKKFFSQYPKSNYIPDIRMLIAASTTNIDESIQQYHAILNLYRYYIRRDAVYFSLCELYYIKSDWGNLYLVSNQAIKECSFSNYLPSFFQFRAIAHYKHSHYDDGIADCEKVPDYSREYDTLAFNLFLKSEMDRQVWGYSRTYIADLSELMHGYTNASIYPSIIYQLGQYYQNKSMYNHAWSTYTHLVQMYPKSPEAAKAKVQIDLLAKYNPKQVHFIPDESLIAQATTIDLTHSYDKNQEQSTGQIVYYTISIGPFYNMQSAKELQKLITTYVVPVHIVQKQKSFEIYAGHFTSIDESMNVKVQLAEELGINGFIIEIYKQNGKQYIYGQ